MRVAVFAYLQKVSLPRAAGMPSPVKGHVGPRLISLLQNLLLPSFQFAATKESGPYSQADRHYYLPQIQPAVQRCDCALCSASHPLAQPNREGMKKSERTPRQQRETKAARPAREV